MPVIMKNIEIKTRWIVIFWMMVCILIIVTKISVWYYANHFISIKVWHQRSKGGDIFYLQGLKIKTPNNCALRTPKTTSEMWSLNPEEISFLCATTPISYEFVDLSKSIPDAEGIRRLKNISEKFTESDEYVHAIIGMKIGLGNTSKYYLKHQNITISSNSEELAKKFADLLVKYDFRVNAALPLDRAALSTAN
jgi:hypothetical protein